MFQLGDTMNVDIDATPLDADGNPIANPDGTMTYSVDTPALALVTPSPDNVFLVNVRTLPGPNSLGAIILTAVHQPADATLPSDTGTLGITIVATQEVGVALTPRTPVPNVPVPVPPPPAP